MVVVVKCVRDTRCECPNGGNPPQRGFTRRESLINFWIPCDYDYTGLYYDTFELRNKTYNPNPNPMLHIDASGF